LKLLFGVYSNENSVISTRPTSYSSSVQRNMFPSQD